MYHRWILKHIDTAHTIDEETPCLEVSQSHVANLRRRNREAEAAEYTSTQEKGKAKWIRDHAIAFNEAVTACDTNYMMLTQL